MELISVSITNVREAVIQLTRSIEGMPEKVYLYESLKELLPNT